MSKIIKGFIASWVNDVDIKIIDTEVDVTISRVTGVWLADSGRDTSSYRMIVGCHDETDAARAYAAYCKAHGYGTSQVYRLFPLLSTEPIEEDQLGDTHVETWSAFADAWIEVRL